MAHKIANDSQILYPSCRSTTRSSEFYLAGIYPLRQICSLSESPFSLGFECLMLMDTQSANFFLMEIIKNHNVHNTYRKFHLECNIEKGPL